MIDLKRLNSEIYFGLGLLFIILGVVQLLTLFCITKLHVYCIYLPEILRLPLLPSWLCEIIEPIRATHTRQNSKKNGKHILSAGMW